MSCRTCGLAQRVGALEPGMAAECPRCGDIVTERGAGRTGITAALALAALILYVPANVYPILRMSLHGAYSENTLWEGVVTLVDSGEWLVGIIVFLASIVIPFAKLLGLFFLSITSRVQAGWWRRERARLHKFINVIGPWAMLDVFLLAVLVALVKLEQLATVLPGRGLAAFTAVVVLTMLASASFDPKSIWESEENHGRAGAS